MLNFCVSNRIGLMSTVRPIMVRLWLGNSGCGWPSSILDIRIW